MSRLTVVRINTLLVQKLTPLSEPSDTKLKPITTWLPAFSHALGSLLCSLRYYNINI